MMQCSYKLVIFNNEVGNDLYINILYIKSILCKNFILCKIVFHLKGLFMQTHIF